MIESYRTANNGPWGEIVLPTIIVIQLYGNFRGCSLWCWYIALCTQRSPGFRRLNPPTPR